jgi:hypothetical protein
MGENSIGHKGAEFAYEDIKAAQWQPNGTPRRPLRISYASSRLKRVETINVKTRKETEIGKTYGQSMVPK